MSVSFKVSRRLFCRHRHNNKFVVPPNIVCPDTLSSPLTPSDVKVFRHEFITIFRYSHSLSVHPSDLRLLCTIDEQSALHDEEKETVWLTKEVMERLQRLMGTPKMSMRMGSSRQGSVNMRSCHQRSSRSRVMLPPPSPSAVHSHGIPQQRVVTFQC